jgi:VanZ family protein
VSPDSRRQQWNRWGIVLAYMAALFVLSSIPNPPALGRSGSDKLIHAALYAGLGGVTVRALAQGRWYEIRLAHSVGALLIAIVYGAFDELHQSFVAGRESNLGDLAADALGAAAAAVGLWVWGILTKKISNRSQKPEARSQNGGT